MDDELTARLKGQAQEYWRQHEDLLIRAWQARGAAVAVENVLATMKPAKPAEGEATDGSPGPAGRPA